MSPTQTTTRKATSRQLRYLRVLAEQTGTSFTSPDSSSHASREIQRLTELKKTRGRHIETPEHERREVYGTAPKPEEVSGWGSQARWKTTPSPVAPRPETRTSVGVRTELARYTATGEERVIYGQRINGHVRVTDRPAAGSGRSYLIECGVERDGYSALKALVADYLKQGQELDQVPMAMSLIGRDIESAAQSK